MSRRSLLAIAGCGDPAPSRIAVQRSERLQSPPPVLAPVEASPEQTLLDNYRKRPPQTAAQWEAEARTWVLPQKTKRLDAVLFIGIAQADLGAIEAVLAPHATWGLPDLRRIGERPIFGDEGPGPFLHAFQRAALRFPPKPESMPSAVPDGISHTFATGAEPMWSVLRAAKEGEADEFIVLRKIIFQGRPVIDYVGFWYDGPPDGPPQFGDHLGAAPPTKPPMDRSAIPEALLGPPRSRLE